MERKRIAQLRNKLIPAKEKQLAKLQAAKTPNQAAIDRAKLELQDLRDEATILEKQLADRANEANDYLSGKTGSYTTTAQHYTTVDVSSPSSPTGLEGVGPDSDFATETEGKIGNLWLVGGIAVAVILGLLLFIGGKKKRK